MAISNKPLADQMLDEASQAASVFGFKSVDVSAQLMPAYFDDFELSGAFYIGESYAINYNILISAAEKDASHSCGQSDVLYERKVHGAYKELLAQSPNILHSELLAKLKRRGYKEVFLDYEPRTGECNFTGIETDCCPCCQHE